MSFNWFLYIFICICYYHLNDIQKIDFMSQFDANKSQKCNILTFYFFASFFVVVRCWCCCCLTINTELWVVVDNLLYFVILIGSLVVLRVLFASNMVFLLHIWKTTLIQNSLNILPFPRFSVILINDFFLFYVLIGKCTNKKTLIAIELNTWDCLELKRL